MRYTVYTDGAYTADKKIGGCAYLILTEDTYIDSRSICLPGASNPTNVETIAVGMAAARLIDIVQEGDSVDFKIDCLSTVDYCRKSMTTEAIYSKLPKVIKAIKTIRKLESKCRVSFDKVRGHKNSLNPNTIVDRLSKIAIRRD